MEQANELVTLIGGLYWLVFLMAGQIRHLRAVK